MVSATRGPNTRAACHGRCMLRLSSRLGSTDRHLLVFLQRSHINAAGSLHSCRRANPSGGGGRNRWSRVGPVSLAAHHELPSNACDLVGQCHGHELRRLAPKQIQKPGRRLPAAPLSDASKKGGGSDDQSASQGLVARVRDRDTGEITTSQSVPDPLAWFYSATPAWNQTGVDTSARSARNASFRDATAGNSRRIAPAP